MMPRLILVAACLLATTLCASGMNCGRNKRPIEYWEQKWDFFPTGIGARVAIIHNGTSHVPSNVPDNCPSLGQLISTYCLFEGLEFLQFRTLRLDDIYQWYYGESLTLYTIDPDTGRLTIKVLGVETGNFVHVVKAGHITAAQLTKPRKKKYALIGASILINYAININEVVVTREELLGRFPQHEYVIKKFALPANSMKEDNPQKVKDGPTPLPENIGN